MINRIWGLYQLLPFPCYISLYHNPSLTLFHTMIGNPHLNPPWSSPHTWLKYEQWGQISIFKGPTLVVVFVLFYYDITWCNVLWWPCVIFTITAHNIVVRCLEYNFYLQLCIILHTKLIYRWKALDDEARKPFVEEADRLRQLHQQVITNQKHNWEKCADTDVHSLQFY